MTAGGPKNRTETVMEVDTAEMFFFILRRPRHGRCARAASAMLIMIQVRHIQLKDN